MVEKVVEYIKHPTKIFVFLQNRCNFKVLPDKLYLKICYKLAMGKKLNLKNPQTFNEKLQWLKLYDRKPEYTRMVDKYEAKKYVAEKIGEEYIIPTLGVWNHFDEIDFDALPDQFVLKCTHDSGGLVIVKDKSQLDKAAAKKKIEKSLKRNYYYSGREWPYKDVKPRIIAEPYMEDKKLGELRDYKFFVFHGEIDSVCVCKDRHLEYANFFYYDMEWNRLEYTYFEPKVEHELEKPKNLEEMIEVVGKLAENLSHIRVDLYNIDEKIYFGELTFYNSSGFDIGLREQTEIKWGHKLVLPTLQ